MFTGPGAFIVVLIDFPVVTVHECLDGGSFTFRPAAYCFRTSTLSVPPSICIIGFDVSEANCLNIDLINLNHSSSTEV